MAEEKKNGNNLFPKVQRSITDFLLDQEGNIPRNKILTVGSMMVLLTVLMAQDAFAKHSSHSSHKSHSSHSSGSGGHSSHESHVSHVSHSSHVSGEHSAHSSSTHSSTADTQSPVPPYSGGEATPSAINIQPPQIPQPNVVQDVLPNLSSAAPVVPDSGTTPDFAGATQEMGYFFGEKI